MLITGWLVTVWAAWFIPVSRPVAEMNAFAGRGVWIMTAIGKAVMIGATATYGALIGGAVQLHASDGGDIPLEASNEWVFTPLLIAITVLPWIFGMCLAWDLFRAGPGGRRLAAERCADVAMRMVHRLQGARGAHPSRAVVVARCWLSDAIEHVLRPGAALILAYFGPLCAVVVLHGLVSPASANLL